MIKPSSTSALLLAVLAVLCAGPALAQETPPAEPDKAEDLAKQLTNPVADLVSIPFQFNWANGVGEDDAMRFILNVQPVVPFSISENWNLIGRFILPFISQPPLAPGDSAESGTGDITLSAFFSPKKGKLVWGVGPVFGIPTTTNPALGSGKWSIGPTVVVLKLSGPWTYGILANQLWSYADTSDVDRSDVNQAYFQPFLVHTSKKAVSLGINSETIANWEADSGQKWTVPVNIFASKVTKLGPFPFSIQGGMGYYFESPDIGPSGWQLRMAFTLILPNKK
jgi:hypothetical protein